MAGADTKTEGVAAIYGGVLLELADEKGAADSLLEELTDFTTFLDADKDFERFLLSADVDANRRSAVIEKAMRGRASDLFVNSLQVIMAKGRIDIIRAIIEAYRLAYETLQNRVDVHVTSAVPLSEELRRMLVDAASKYSGHQAKLIETVDESVIGGLTVQIGDTKLDSSVSSHLRRIRLSLAQSGLQKILGDGSGRFVEKYQLDE